MPDQYASCQCGSGKKFKWCCQPIYPAIQQALEADEAGQHEAALRIIDRLTVDHPGNPEAWGQKARLLYANGNAEQAEEALEKAFTLNANYPFGLMLKAKVRHDEGEFLGSLLLARRAADAYDPQAREVLSQLYYMIFDSEMRRNCPVAGRAALEQVMAAQPADESLRSGFEAVFGDEARLPVCARKKYELRKAAAARRPAWDKALGGAARLGDLAKAFESLPAGDDKDAPAWFNLGVARAWLGDNDKALEALERYIDLEPDESAAAEAAALGEVLRCAHGLEERSDYCDHVAMLPLRDPEPINRLLNEWNESRRLVPIPTEEGQNVFTALVLEVSAGGLVTVGRPAADIGRLAAYLVVAGNMMRLSGPVQETFDRLREEVRGKLGLGLTELQSRKAPVQFHDVSTEAVVFPVGPVTDRDKAADRAVEQAGRFYEDTWIHRPRKSLNNITPADAAASGRLRKKLRGVVDFVEECARGGMIAEYDFGKLRRKLGLSGAAAPKAGAPSDVAALGAAELAALSADALSDEQLEQAYQAARRLDAQDAATNFARALVARPAAGKPDRYPLFLYLSDRATRQGAHDEALDHVNEGQRLDCEHNGGKRRDEYELLRARTQAKRGDAAGARDAYASLIQRSPRNFEARGQAAKAMLDLKDAAAALAFAEDGVKAARQANNRDAEQMLLELTDAAKRAGS